MSGVGARRSRLGLTAAALAFAMEARAAHAAPRRYVLDPAASRLEIHVGKTGLLGFAGHVHEVVAGTFQGNATFDPDRIAASAVDLTIDAGALRVSGQGEPPADVPQVQAAMLGPACLDASHFPTIRFVSVAVADAGADAKGRDLTLHGELTLHGVKRAVTMRVHLDLTGAELAATGRTTLRQSDFGITPISKAGVVKVKDELEIVWRIRGAAR
jgi:polyisoprenoid-binding protein YceI